LAKVGDSSSSKLKLKLLSRSDIYLSFAVDSHPVTKSIYSMAAIADEPKDLLFIKYVFFYIGCSKINSKGIKQFKTLYN
jgi:hypothetical protein